MSRENGRRRLAGRTAKIAVPTVAALGAGTAIAAGAIPSSDGTINGCARDSRGHNDGSLRVVQDPTDCTKHETAISWNQQGPKGDTGPQGLPGAKGDTGPQGPAGPSGSEATMVGGVPLIGGTADMFLTGDGLHGSSTDAAHKDAVAIKAFSFSGTSSSSIGSQTGGAGAGKVKFDSFHIEKLYDSSSPTLVADMATGKHIPTVTVSFARPGDSQDFLTYTFNQVIVTSYKQGGDQEPPLLENVGFDFGSVQWDYTTSGKDGGPSSSGGWDVVENKGT